MPDTLQSLLHQLEISWKNFDAVYSTFDAAKWAQKFGRTWTYAEQPYHLTAFDRFHLEHMMKGERIPKSEQVVFRTARDVDNWNAREFGKRKPGHSVEESLREMNKCRDEVRKFASSLTDKDLGKKVWASLLGGWVTFEDVFKGMIVHNTGEYQKLWLRTGKKGPLPTPEATHLRLNLIMNFMKLTLDKEAAKGKQFTMVWNFTGPGGGAWTLRVEDGTCTVSEGAAEKPDFTMTMKPVTMQKLVAKMQSPLTMMLTGEMKPRPLYAMGTFGKLFPEPKPDQVIVTEDSKVVLG